MFQATTIVAVRKDGRGAMAGDGQVTFGQHDYEHGARKVRRLYGGRVVAGFAGAAADSFALFEKFEGKLETFHGNLLRLPPSRWRKNGEPTGASATGSVAPRYGR